MPLSALRLGMRVEVKADDDGCASAVTVSSEVIGRIASLSASGFTVAGQEVRMSSDAAAPTVFEGVAGLAGLAVNDFVEVHGARDAAGVALASRVERKEPSAAVATRLVGTVNGVEWHQVLEARRPHLPLGRRDAPAAHRYRAGRRPAGHRVDRGRDRHRRHRAGEIDRRARLRPGEQRCRARRRSRQRPRSRREAIQASTSMRPRRASPRAWSPISPTAAA
jgi:hypothetical protein